MDLLPKQWNRGRPSCLKRDGYRQQLSLIMRLELEVGWQVCASSVGSAEALNKGEARMKDKLMRRYDQTSAPRGA